MVKGFSLLLLKPISMVWDQRNTSLDHLTCASPRGLRGRVSFPSLWIRGREVFLITPSDQYTCIGPEKEGIYVSTTRNDEKK
jgi:hypothetical protein